MNLSKASLAAAFDGRRGEAQLQCLAVQARHLGAFRAGLDMPR